MLSNSMSPTEALFSLLSWLFVIPFIFAFVFKAPKLVALGFIAVLFLFSNSTWGELEVNRTIYSRGVGMFYFSLLNLVLFIAGAAVLCKKLANRQAPDLAPPLSKYVLGFVYLLAGHVAVGLMLGIDLNVILGYRGLINLFNMLIFMYLIIMSFREENDVRDLLITVLALAAVRGIFGVVRYVWFGGDEANPYRNFDGLDIKLLFFDICDNYVAGLGAFCAAWLLTTSQMKVSLFQRALLLGFLALEVVVVALSFRRASLLGLGLMFALLFFQLPRRSKLIFALFACGMLAGIAFVFFQHRLQFNTEGSILDALIFDVSPDKRLSENRFYELYAAAQSLRGGNWLFGLGSWGTFEGDDRRLAYHLGDFSFVHSGFGHMILKAGVVGLILFCGMLLAYTGYYFKNRKYLSGGTRLLADLGFAGFLFWLPTLLIGTPIIEFRTMLLLGLTLAMPFVAVGLQAARSRSYYVYAAQRLDPFDGRQPGVGPAAAF